LSPEKAQAHALAGGNMNLGRVVLDVDQVSAGSDFETDDRRFPDRLAVDAYRKPGGLAENRDAAGFG
jgi:hypothetical protein